ncbi:MAG: class I SAM-dependent methyltransferase [bacterium]|nr:class I SAM-dependent methyltransferase [bacterium]
MEKFEDKEPSIADSTDEEVFQKYVDDLRLSPEDFDKKILDMGAGIGQFSKWAREHRVSSQIYSMDKSTEFLQGENAVAGKAETLPFTDNSFDLVVSDAAIPHTYMGEGDPGEVEEKVALSLNEAVRVLKPGGEIRLAGVLMGDLYENQKILTRSIQAALDRLKENGVQVILEHTPSGDTYEYDGHVKKNLLAKAYLVTIKKPN